MSSVRVCLRACGSVPVESLHARLFAVPVGISAIGGFALRSSFAKTDAHTRQYCAFRHVYVIRTCYARKLQHVYARTHVYMHARTHYVRTYMYAHMHARTCIARAYAHTHYAHMRVRTYVARCPALRTHVRTYTVCMHTLHVWTRTYRCMHTRVHTVRTPRICMDTHIPHACTRVYTYTHIYCNFRSACVALAHFSHHEQAQGALGYIVRRLGRVGNAVVGRAIVCGGWAWRQGPPHRRRPEEAEKAARRRPAWAWRRRPAWAWRRRPPHRRRRQPQPPF